MHDNLNYDYFFQKVKINRYKLNKKEVHNVHLFAVLYS